jgi:hypothetical protein
MVSGIDMGTLQDEPDAPDCWPMVAKRAGSKTHALL